MASTTSTDSQSGRDPRNLSTLPNSTSTVNLHRIFASLFLYHCFIEPTKPPACANFASSDRFTSALHQNKDWAAQIAKEDPSLFPTLAVGQHPEILWIGCSDSRCPETTLLGLKPGDVFVHRNIANVLHAGDLSSSAVIEYAVRYLQVKHVVLCGHTSCGGVAAALGNKQLGILDPWLLPLRQLRAKHLDLLNSLPADEANLKLVELNVLEGVKLLKEKNVILEAVQDRGLQVHGLIYDVGSGVLRELDTDESEAAIKARLTSFKTDI
eukprot:XP_001390254.2 carbonic anhydrase [Aspergillus niger CBS 513.88]